MKTKMSLTTLVRTSAVLLCLVAQLICEDLPKLYEHFTRDGIKSGLIANGSTFILNGKPIKIVSGAIHYFRVHPAYWRDRLRKLRAAGLNAVETYAPWNLHEPRKDFFDFGDKNQDFSAFLDVRGYLKIAQEEDLLVIFRPGPYICAEVDFGGLPSWLLHDSELEVRRYNKPFLQRVESYFNQLLPLLAKFKFTSGGPVVAIQIENEYGLIEPREQRYLEWLTDLVESLGFNDTLLFTSDKPSSKLNGTLPGRLFHTVNGDNDMGEYLNQMKTLEPAKPRFVMELYSGFMQFWFDSKSQSENLAAMHSGFIVELERILGPKIDGNVNVYMFHGGTNFGFMAGAYPSIFDPSYYTAHVTSYDYGAPLSEAGDPTPLYYKIIDVVGQYQSPRLHRPNIPQPTTKMAYGQLEPIGFLRYEMILQQVPEDSRFFVRKPTSMEDLPINDNNGQSYGYIVHRSKFHVETRSEFEVGVVKDFGLLLVDGVIQTGSYDGCFTNSLCYWIQRTKNIRLDGLKNGEHTLDLFVENMGRKSNGTAEKKGLPDGFISLNGRHLEDFEVFALEFKSDWVNNLRGYEPIVMNFEGTPGPVIALFVLEIVDKPADTFVSMRGWHKGIVLVNGFNLGRYWKVGPQQSLYLPAPLLKTGLNTIVVFEEIETGNSIRLEDVPDIGNR